jgi:hypothetical protein
MSIRCLTWQQPYASAVAAQVKKVENRPRCIVRVPAGGMWVGLHAGIGWYGAMDPCFGAWLTDPNLKPHPRGLEHRDQMEAFRALWPACPSLRGLPLGRVLGAVHFAWDEPYPDGDESDQIFGAPRRGLLRGDPWAFGKHCYFIDEVRLLPEPIPCRGMQGLWPAPPEIATALDQLVAGGGR